METLDYTLSQFIPRFIQKDRNGAAMVAAINAGLQLFTQSVEYIEVLQTDPANMPEWALDEIAWASATPWYDFTADVETKRGWVQYADAVRACVGTRGAIKRLLLGMYDQCKIEEYWEYGAELHHFRVAVRGEYSALKTRWAVNAINAVKPLRSVLDGLSLAAETSIAVSETRLMGLYVPPVCGTMACGEEFSL